MSSAVSEGMLTRTNSRALRLSQVDPLAPDLKKSRPKPRDGIHGFCLLLATGVAHRAETSYIKIFRCDQISAQKKE